MTTYKYAVGESIVFTNGDRTRSAASGRYQIVARRPVNDGKPWYVIKSDLEPHERVVAESDLG
jgi:muramidase (phage lysozyme)